MLWMDMRKWQWEYYQQYPCFTIFVGVYSACGMGVQYVDFSGWMERVLTAKIQMILL